MATYETLIDCYNQIMSNCKYYEREQMPTCLANEIGVLRGVAYAMEMAGECPHNPDFMHFIEIQNELTKAEHDENTERIKKRQRGEG